MNIYNVIILDESGSMSSIYRETLTSMNEVLNGIRKDQEEHSEQKNFVTIVTFEGNGIKGNVLFISSEAGETADVRPYGLTKAAVNSLAQGLAYAYASDGIRINIISPGVTATAMTGFNSDEDLFSNTSPAGRVYLPLEIAELATFLLSDVSSSISGQILTCNNARKVNARWKK